MVRCLGNRKIILRISVCCMSVSPHTKLVGALVIHSVNYIDVNLLPVHLPARRIVSKIYNSG